MELWMSSESDKEADNRGLAIAGNSIEEQINKHLKEANYTNKQVVKLRVISILMESTEFNDNKYCEIVRMRKTTKKHGMHLRLPYHEFNSADIDKKRELIYDLLERSIDILEEKGIKNLEKVREIITKSRDENIDEYLAHYDSIWVGDEF